jgi:signal transduction histidine kinase
LRAITYLTEWLVEDAGDALPDVARGHVAKMRQRVDRMEQLLNDMLAYSRAGRQFHAPETVNCVALVRNIVDLLTLPPGFVITISDALPVLHTERVPLETVFLNLLSNAIKHHDHPSTGHVWVTAQPHGDSTEFAVTDNGPCIDPQYHARIFEAFQALKPRDQTEGSGIGLAVVKKIVERRNGTVWVKSEVGKGATFYFTWASS